MRRDIHPIFLIANGGGSSCIHGEGLGIEGWDCIAREGDGFAIGAGSGD